MCKPCACELEVCAKCGKKEDIVTPFNKEPEKTENTEKSPRSKCRRSRRENEEKSDEDLDFDIDLDDSEEDDNQVDEQSLKTWNSEQLLTVTVTLSQKNTVKS